ncbi:MAG TPA: S8 family serine peptidase [Pyrinomonadaceae bacterium]|nr:S8 family serine peptidase [Pyrinomonadaceae bacterium]
MAQSESAVTVDNDLIDLWSQIEPEALWKGRTGRGVRVGVVDSGIDTEHPELAGKIKASYQAVNDGGQIVFKESTSGDQAGHGTACAGIISSVAPDVEITSIKVLGPTGSGTGEMFLMGVDFAIKQKLQVVNLSLGTTKRDFWMPMRELLDKAYRERVMLVAAANNLPQLSSPSIFSSSLVSVVKRAGGDPFNFGFQYGEVIELVAPGVQVETTWPGGGRRQMTGNSFAAPYVTGVIALLLEARPDLTPFQIKTILYAIAQKNQAKTAAAESSGQ